MAVLSVLLLCLVTLLKSSTLNDVEHIVIFMQENRAFDHYYGAMSGVRGFNDRASPLLPSGRSPFYQPVTGKFDDDDYMLPFHLSFDKTSATCMGAPTMSYNCDIHIINNGKMDGWNTARSPGWGMSHFNRTDLPFYYALADNYLIGDNYFQSTFSPTIPNRLHLFSGSNGLSVNSSFCILDDSEPNGVDWITMGELLENANISWRVYQEQDNFDDNGFAWFDVFKAAKPGSDLYDKGMYRSNNLYDEFANDVRNGNLTQVSWIVGPSTLSEHATHHPQDGEDLSARLIKIFSEPENKDIYSKTVFMLNYDEGGQFYDHLWTPTAPMNQPKDGQSTVTTEGEVTKQTEHGIPAGNPIGPGFRVPFFIVSPWTRRDGGIVYSELTDHTSTIQFIEKRFGIYNPNISPWRRAVMSDLLYAFDFDNPDYTFPTLPDTSQNVNQSNYQCHNNPAPQYPKTQFMPTQEEGNKTSRALPYKFNITDTVDKSKMQINIVMSNIGDASVVFHVFDYLNMNVTLNPRKFTIEPNKQLSDSWDIEKDGTYNISLHGPNGYVRQFSSASVMGSGYDINMKEIVDDDVSVVFGVQCVLSICTNDLIIEDMAYGDVKQVENGLYQRRDIKKSVSKSGNWYDYILREVDDNGISVMERRFMGRVETGKDSITDPAMAIPRKEDKNVKHPDVTWYFEQMIAEAREKWAQITEMCHTGDEFIKDMCLDH